MNVSFRITKRRSIVALALLLLAASAVVAYAVWQTTLDQPPAKGQFGSLAVTSAMPSAAPTNKCFPGTPCDGNIRVVVPAGSGSLKITSLTASSAATVTVSGGVGSCLPADITGNVSIPAKTGLNIPLTVGSNDVLIPNLFNIDAAIPSTCQGATFTWNASSPSFVVTVSQ